MRYLILAAFLMLAASPASAQCDPNDPNSPPCTATPTDTPTETPTSTPTNTPAASPVATGDSRISNSSESVTYYALANGTPRVVVQPGSGERVIVTGASVSSTAAATVKLYCDAALQMVTNVAAGVPFDLPGNIYCPAGKPVILERSAGSANADAVLWTTTRPQ